MGGTPNLQYTHKINPFASAQRIQAQLKLFCEDRGAAGASVVKLEVYVGVHKSLTSDNRRFRADYVKICHVCMKREYG